MAPVANAVKVLLYKSAKQASLKLFLAASVVQFNLLLLEVKTSTYIVVAAGRKGSTI